MRSFQFRVETAKSLSAEKTSCSNKHPCGVPAPRPIQCGAVCFALPVANATTIYLPNFNPVMFGRSPTLCFRLIAAAREGRRRLLSSASAPCPELCARLQAASHDDGTLRDRRRAGPAIGSAPDQSRFDIKITTQHTDLLLSLCDLQFAICDLRFVCPEMFYCCWDSTGRSDLDTKPPTTLVNLHGKPAALT